MQTVNADRLAQLRRARRGLEVDAAETIGRYLLANRSEEIRSLVLNMLAKIQGLFDRHVSLAFVAGAVLWHQKSLAMWAKVPGAHWSEQGLAAVYDYVAWTRPVTYDWLIVCSDVIRLFGEFSENPTIAALPDDAWTAMRGKGALRPEPVYAKPELAPDPDKEKQPVPDRVVLWGHRDREERKVQERRRIEAPFVPLPRQVVKWRGVELFKFESASVISTIDYTYGLQQEGGDVSGTTTDSIAALRWASSGEDDPVTQLIAIATMVPQGHHTIVECAWPLTRHGYMDYCIGFYGTLVPGGDDYSALRGSLEALDRDARNRHLFVVCDPLPLSFLFEKADEIREYRKISGVRKAYSICAGGKIDLRGAQNVMRAHGISDLVVSRLAYWG